MLALWGWLLAAAVFEVHTQAKPPREIAERAADSREKIVCKRFLRTGSLVDGYRECKPKWQWERERENLRHPNTTAGTCDPTGTGPGC